jgi:hypothetical protein
MQDKERPTFTYRLHMRAIRQPLKHDGSTKVVHIWHGTMGASIDEDYRMPKQFTLPDFTTPGDQYIAYAQDGNVQVKLKLESSDRSTYLIERSYTAINGSVLTSPEMEHAQALSVELEKQLQSNGCKLDERRGVYRVAG